MFLRFVTDFSLDLLEGGAVVALVAGLTRGGGGGGGGVVVSAGLCARVGLSAWCDQDHHDCDQDEELHLRTVVSLLHIWTDLWES